MGGRVFWRVGGKSLAIERGACSPRWFRITAKHQPPKIRGQRLPRSGGLDPEVRVLPLGGLMPCPGSEVLALWLGSALVEA